MPVEVRKQDRETPQSLIRRFTKRIQRSGVLIQARKNRFHARTKSRFLKKRMALRREETRVERKRQEKLGKPKEK